MNKGEIPAVLGGLGIAILSTSKGLITDKEARKQGVGGELVYTVCTKRAADYVKNRKTAD